MKDKQNNPFTFRYRNWRGQESNRRVIPSRVYFDSTPHHKEPQWIMEAFDLDRQVARAFSMTNILGPPVENGTILETESRDT